MYWQTATSHLTKDFLSAVLFIASFWKGDDILSDQGKKDLYSYFRAENLSNADRETLDFMRLYFNDEQSIAYFALNILRFTFISLLIGLSIYVFSIPGFALQLLTDSDSLYRFSEQVASDGFLKAYLINFIGVKLYFSRIRDFPTSPWANLIVDISTKIFLFFGLTAISYLLHAHFLGSFKGDYLLALRAIGPTIWNALLLKNLTSAYLVCVAVGSLPLFLTAFSYYMRSNASFSRLVRAIFLWLPFEGRPIRALSVISGAFYAVFFAISSIFILGLGNLMEASFK